MKKAIDKHAKHTATELDRTSRASVAQLDRARDCQSLGRRFDSVKNPTTQIPTGMNLNFIDPQTRVLNYI